MFKQKLELSKKERGLNTKDENKVEKDVIKTYLEKEDKFKLEKQLNEIFKILNKLEGIIKILNRNIEMKLVVLPDTENRWKNDDTRIIKIRVENYEEGYVYYWTRETLEYRYNKLNELLKKFIEENVDIFNLKNE